MFECSGAFTEQEETTSGDPGVDGRRILKLI
jgi:hypothetical protein